MHPAGRLLRMVQHSMIVEPSPTNPRSPIGRLLRAAGVGAPVVLFAVVLGVGLLGPKVESAPPVSRISTPSVAAATPPAFVPAAEPAATPSPTGLATVLGAPAAVANLRVRSIADALDVWSAGKEPRVVVVAVAGYLRVVSGDASACGRQTGIPGSSCARSMTLAEWPGGVEGRIGDPGNGRHVHGVVPPGVLVPGDPGGPPLQDQGGTFVVVIARFGSTDQGCTGDLRGCTEPFTIERVAWADGVRVPLLPAAEAGLTPDPADPILDRTYLALNPGLAPVTALLNVTLVTPDGLALLDPGAAIAAGQAGFGTPGTASDGATASAWYLRGVDVPYDPVADPPYGRRDAVVRWAVIVPSTGEVIARGILAPRMDVGTEA